jgi:CHASE3 domain sensor protein
LLEVLREEEVVQLEEELLRRLEEKLTPLVQQAASDAAKMAMHQLRLDLMGHISRHEDTIRRLKRSEAALNHIPTSSR